MTAQRVARMGVAEPRIYTQPLRDVELPANSLGHSVILFADKVLPITLLPWQRWLLKHMLEVNPDGSLRFRTIVLLMARQNGKSTLSQVLALWFMYVRGVAMVIGTAQDLDVAEEIWQGAVEIVEDTPELDALKESVVRVNGKKALVLKSGERYKVKAANRRAGRGLSGDLILLDELREHQSWDAWGAITKTTMARSFALVLALSNAGDASSVVLRYLRMVAHLGLGDPDGINADATVLGEAAPAPDVELDIDEDDDSLGIFEWSAPPGCDLRDRDGWAMANPSLGYTITEKTVAAACRLDPEWVFRTEVLCQWSEGTLEGPFPAGAWEASGDSDSRRASGAKLALCVDTSWDRATTHIAMAALRADGLPHVEVIASRAGTEWVADWLTSPERAADVLAAPVAVQSKGAPVSSLTGALRDAGVDVIDWHGGDLGAATGAFYDRVRIAVGEGNASAGLRHRSQPLLNLAAATASMRPLGDAFVWDRKKSPTDVSPLIAATGALWLLGTKPEPPRVSAYETRRLEVM